MHALLLGTWQIKCKIGQSPRGNAFQVNLQSPNCSSTLDI